MMQFMNPLTWLIGFQKTAMPKTNAKVYESPLLDGVGIWVENKINPLTSTKTNDELTAEIKQVLKDTDAEIIVSYLPVGSDKVTAFWAQICLDTDTLHL